jgi:hypothetical protein
MLECDGTGWQIVGGYQNVNQVGYFSVYRNTNQTVTTNVNGKVQFDAEERDDQAWFDSTTNYRYQPLIPGYYELRTTVDNLNSAINRIELWKNGALERGLNVAGYAGALADLYAHGSAIVQANGTTDYFEIYCNPGSVALTGGRTKTWLVGHYLGNW